MSAFNFCVGLLLISTCWLIKDISAERITTCDVNVHRLTCDVGVIVAQSSLYGRRDAETCSEGRPPQELSNTKCSLTGADDFVKRRCDGKKVCELDSRVLASDPCPGTNKYLDTNYTCFPAIRTVACEGSTVQLFCDEGQVIFVYGADFGRRDRTTCITGRPTAETQKVDCVNPTTVVATRCNGKNRCSVKAINLSVHPCQGTYKYLEVAYRCEFHH